MLPLDLSLPCLRKAWWRGLVFSLALLLAWPLSAAWARPTTAMQAQQVVQNWLSMDRLPLRAKLGKVLKEVRTYSDSSGQPLYYIVYLDPAGLVIVPGDDLVEPIIGFLPEGTYDPSPANPLGALVSRDVPARVLDAREMEKRGPKEKLQAGAMNAFAAAQSKWARLADSSIDQQAVETGVPSVSDHRVDPLVQSLWAQDTVGGLACYNYYTPPNASGDAANYVCGCVATAMAQLMRYWQHPASPVAGTFTISISGSPTTRGIRGGSGSAGPYDWANMVLNPAGSGVNLTQRQAIGSLTADAGVSVNMDYDTSEAGGSGTDTSYASYAFVNTFGYSNAVSSWTGDSSTSIPAANRNNMLNPNLDAGFPTMLGIRGAAGGHAVICDGYGYNDATLYHHLNMGWSGSDNAWYNLPTVDASWVTFDVQYKIIYNVYKTGTGEIISGRVTNSSGSPINEATVTATGGYSTTTNAYGIYALAKVPSGATFSVNVTKTGFTFTPQSVTMGTSISSTSAPFTPGDYPNVSPSTTTGNKWGINFTGAAAVNHDISPIAPLLLD